MKQKPYSFRYRGFVISHGTTYDTRYLRRSRQLRDFKTAELKALFNEYDYLLLDGKKLKVSWAHIMLLERNDYSKWYKLIPFLAALGVLAQNPCKNTWRIYDKANNSFDDFRVGPYSYSFFRLKDALTYASAKDRHFSHSISLVHIDQVLSGLDLTR